MFCSMVQWKKGRIGPLRMFRGHGGWGPDQWWSMWCLTVVAKGLSHEQCEPRLPVAPQTSSQLKPTIWVIESTGMCQTMHERTAMFSSQMHI